MSKEQNKDMSQYFYRASAADFTNIPSSPIVYWASEKVFNIFSKSKQLSDSFMPRQGLATTDNNRFVRFWFEVSLSNIGFHMRSRMEAEKSARKWFPMDKGGGFRKWYGNNLSIVNWNNDGREIKENILRKYPYLNGNPDFVAKNPNDYFKPGTTWGKITSSSFSCRFTDAGFVFSDAGSKIPTEKSEDAILTTAFLNSCTTSHFLKMLSPTMNFEQGNIARLPLLDPNSSKATAHQLIEIAKEDWNSSDISWDYSSHPLLEEKHEYDTIQNSYINLAAKWSSIVVKTKELEEKNNLLFIEAYGLLGELEPEVPLGEISLTCNPNYRYGGDKTEAELETLLQCDTLRELVSYAIGCMMGRYSLDKPGLILASQGETLQDYLRQIPSPCFAPDDDAILPLTDQEWFADDATNRFRDFVRVVWGDEHLQENLDFVAESLCLHAIKPKRGEAALDTIRRYLSTQFFKDHLRTYKKRPIYWLFSSGKHKAFECLVYLHRYNESTLARMRTEYVIPLTAKMATYVQKLEADKDASTSAAEVKRLEKEIAQLHKQQAELSEFDEKLRHYADQRISLDLDDGVKVNYGKFGDLLAEVKAVTGESPEALS